MRKKLLVHRLLRTNIDIGSGCYMGTWNGEQMWSSAWQEGQKDGFIKWIQSWDYTAHLKKNCDEKGRLTLLRPFWGQKSTLKMGFGSARHIVLHPRGKLKLSCYHKAQFRALHSVKSRSKNLKTPLHNWRKIPRKINLLKAHKNLKNVI